MIYRIQLHNRLIFLASVLTVLICASCSPKEQIGVSEDPRLQTSFSGYYKTCEEITLAFGANGRFACQLNSTEIVGHFCDVVWGTYSADSTHVYLHVDRCNEDNLVYNSLPVELADSILFTSSRDSLIIYFDDPHERESVLLSGKQISSFPTSGKKDDGIVVIVIWGFVLILTFAGRIALVVLLWWLISKLIKKSRGK